MILPPYYVAIPKSGSGRGVLALHSWCGLNAVFKRLCDRSSDSGFATLALHHVEKGCHKVFRSS